MKNILILALATVAAASQAIVLHDNGSVVNGANGSNPLSILTPPETIFGFGVATAGATVNRMADNFTLANNSTLNGIRLFSYQTGATAFTFTNVSWDIVSGDVNTGGVVASGSAAPTNGGLVAYRVTNTTLTNTQRPIFALDLNGLNVNLSGGQNYWLRWSISGSLASGPWAPPVQPVGTGNAQQSLSGGAFAPALDGTLSTEMPFVLSGTAVPEPATMVALGAGALALIRRRRSK